MAAVPATGEVTVLTSNIFHHPDLIGADGNPEPEMTSATLAALIKQKNPHAQVYLYSELVSDESAFDGTFKRDIRTGFPPDALVRMLEKIELRLERGISMSRKSVRN